MKPLRRPHAQPGVRSRSGSARRRARRARRGVAFVLVLGALTILSVMLSEVQDESSAEFASALSARDSLIAEYAARSGVNLSRLLLASEPTIRGALPILAMMFGGDQPQIPVWNFADRMLGPFSDATGSEAFSSFSGLDLSRSKNLGLPGASFVLNIVDEDSKINVNAAARGGGFAPQRLMTQLMALMTGPQFDPLFERRDADGSFSDRQAICSAIIDWADPDQNTVLCDPTNFSAQDMPAEDSYYELLPKAYHRKNAAFDSLLELRRVRGIGDDYWATFVDPDPDDQGKRLVTVWGTSNAININTAAPQTLLALVCSLAAEPPPPVCIDPNETQKLLTILTMARMFTMGAPPFGSPKAFIKTLKGKGMLGPILESVGLQPIQLKSDQEAENQMTVESKVFSIYATGSVKSGKRETSVRVHSVIDFRNAPPPAEAATTGTGGASSTGGTTAAPSNTQNQGSGGVNSASGEGIAAALRPNPAGNVVYFRLD